MFRNLSYLYKTPLSVSVVILLTAMVVAGTLIAQTYRDAKQDLAHSALSLGKVLSRTLRPALLHDQVWQAYETITTPLDTAIRDASSQQMFILLDANHQIYVSTQPARFPMLATLSGVDSIYANLERQIRQYRAPEPFTVEDALPGKLFFVVPILAEDGVTLGTLVMQYSTSVFLARFYKSLERVAISILAVLVVLLPLGWYGGRRLAAPLIHLAECMGRIGRELPASIECDLHDSRDEIGILSSRFKRMLEELREKHALEKQMVASDRLAAIGRLTAGIAHEVNNPLGGMLNAINTYKRHGTPDALAAKTLSLLERGLSQIEETVAALLVEAKLESHALTPQDIEDARTLIQADVQKKNAHLNWKNDVAEALPLPSTQVRQILLNLLLNAVHAVRAQGNVVCRIYVSDEQLTLSVQNDGACISPQQMEHLFEPFFDVESNGHGLGLWVTYQLVEQLGGLIHVTSEPDNTIFRVTLPLTDGI